jgi:hypothetical protein
MMVNSGLWNLLERTRSKSLVVQKILFAGLQVLKLDLIHGEQFTRG